MSAAPNAVLTSIAMQLAAVLALYEQRSAALASRAFDEDLHAELTAAVDRMKAYAAALPITTAWVGFLIAHTELVRAWLRAGTHPLPAPELEDVVQQHGRALRGLRQACTRYVDAAARGVP